MARIEGVVVEKRVHGNPVIVRIDLRKHKEVALMLIKLGLIHVPNDATIEALKDAESGENITRCKDSKELFNILEI